MNVKKGCACKISVTGLLSVIMATALYSEAFGAYFSVDGLLFSPPDSDNNVAVSGLSDASISHIVIPSSVSYEYEEAEIDEDTGETIYNTRHETCKVTTVGSYAFYGRSSVKSVVIPSSVTTIGSGAFYECTNIDSIEIPGSVTTIGSYAFNSCSGLRTLYLSEGLVNIGEKAFLDCSSLASITIPNSVVNLGARAFYGCEQVKTVSIGESVISDLSDVFVGCDSLLSFSIASGNHKYSVRNSLLCSKDGKDIILCPPTVEELTIPSSVKDIPYYCFAYHQNLRRVDASRVEFIKEGAFSNCPNLREVKVSSSVKSIGSEAFMGCTELTNLELYSGLTSIGESAFEGCSVLDVDIPSSVKEIGYFAFAYTSIKRAHIPSEIEYLGDMAFYGCDKLEVLELPDGLKAIPAGLIEGCTSIDDVDIPESVIEIGSYAFDCCTGLSGNLSLPPNLKSIGECAFYGCNGFTGALSLPESLERIGMGAFFGCCGLTGSVVLPASVSELDAYAFSGCDGIDSIRFSNVPPSVNYYGSETSNPVGSAIGIYPITYMDEWEKEIEGDGYWHGLKMQPQSPDCVVHFDSNGGIFKGADGFTTNRFDQYFTYGESQRLFTSEFTPLKLEPDGNGFLGWVRGTPSFSSPEQWGELFEPREEWQVSDDLSEVTFYAVWTTTLKVTFCSNDAGDAVSPNSLADHLCWCVDNVGEIHKSGEIVQVVPGVRTVYLHVDDDYGWAIGDFLSLNSGYKVELINGVAAIRLNVPSDFTDPFFYNESKENAIDLMVRINPKGVGDIEFFCSHTIRESLQDRIDVAPAFDSDKVSITIGRVGYQESGEYGFIATGLLNDLKPNEVYSLPEGTYYIKSVSYDADVSSGAPYWASILAINLADRTFNIENAHLTSEEVAFGVFGDDLAVKVMFDAAEGDCDKTEMWFTYPDNGPYSIGARIDKTLPIPTKAGFSFIGWFLGNKEKKYGASITDCTLKAWYQRDMTDEWIFGFPNALAAAGGDISTAAAMTAANGTRTVSECYALGINPEDPDDDFRIMRFEMVNGEPVFEYNHTTDGSGDSFIYRIRKLGKANLNEDWSEVPPGGDPTHRFFTVEVATP